jgi:hypothetical protein
MHRDIWRRAGGTYQEIVVAVTRHGGRLRRSSQTAEGSMSWLKAVDVSRARGNARDSRRRRRFDGEQWQYVIDGSDGGGGGFLVAAVRPAR